MSVPDAQPTAKRKPMPAPSPPLRIAILGAGRIGSAFAFQLVRTAVATSPSSPGRTLNG